MSLRVTTEDVLEIFETDLEDLTVFITSANLLINAVCTDSSLTDDQLKEIERWLSAHFTGIRDLRPSSEGAGGVSTSYQTSVGQNLAATMYGQQAMLLDTSGALARWNNNVTKAKANASFSYLGGSDGDNA